MTKNDLFSAIDVVGNQNLLEKAKRAYLTSTSTPPISTSTSTRARTTSKTSRSDSDNESDEERLVLRRRSKSIQNQTQNQSQNQTSTRNSFSQSSQNESQNVPNHSNNISNQNSQVNGKTPEMSNEIRDLVSTMILMGFSETDSINALEVTNSFDEAVELLKLNKQQQPQSHQNSTSPSSTNQKATMVTEHKEMVDSLLIMGFSLDAIEQAMMTRNNFDEVVDYLVNNKSLSSKSLDQSPQTKESQNQNQNQNQTSDKVNQQTENQNEDETRIKDETQNQFEEMENTSTSSQEFNTTSSLIDSEIERNSNLAKERGNEYFKKGDFLEAIGILIF